ncbi:unnamed protein product [Urochloa humidicola]
MAAGKTPTPSTPPFFKVLKAGALLPARNRRLFAAVFVLAVAYTSLLLLFNDLTVEPLADKLLLDAKTISNYSNGTAGPTRSPDEYAKLVHDLGNDARDLAPAFAACLLLDATAGSAVWILALLAAVATFAGETPPSLAALISGKDRAELKGLALTTAFLYALQIAYLAVLLAATAALLAYLSVKGPSLLVLLGCLVLAAAVVLHAYFTLLCALGVVVAAAEPGRRGAGAVARAWRLLMKGRRRRRRAVLLAAVVGVLAAACSRARTLARGRAHASPASELLVGFLYAAALAAVKLLAVCVLTAFYYECTEGDGDAAANTEFVKLATEELVGV